jgi:magnesium transporter
MAKLIKKRSEKTGLPPGTLIHIGEKKTEKVKITVMEYNEATFREKEALSAEDCIHRKDKEEGTVSWITVNGIHQVEIIENICKCFGIHHLTTEDILNTDQRPKTEEFDEYIYIVLQVFFYNSERHELLTEQVSLVVGSHFVISFQENSGDVFAMIRERIKTGKGRIRKMGADYLAYCLMDIIVDKYFPILETMGEEIELLEEELVNQPTPKILRTIYTLKRDMVLLRKSVWPLREVISKLERGEHALFKESTMIYLKDIYDHTIHVIDTLESFRDIVTGMLEIYLSSISNRMTAVMKVLTMIATTFMPLSFIAGIYGMNFQFMPELQWRWGYPIVLLIMVSVGISMIIYFRRKKWL